MGPVKDDIQNKVPLLFCTISSWTSVSGVQSTP